MDAYHAPYKKKTRHWTGLLLLSRIGLFLTFALSSVTSLNSDSINLLTVTSVAAALLAIKGRVYERHYNDIIESSFLLNLCIFSIATYYVKREELEINQKRSQLILSSISAGIAFVTFIGILLYHSYLQLKKTSLWKETVIPYTLKMVPSKGENKIRLSNSKPVDHTAPVITSTIVELREPLLEDDEL